MHRILVVEGRDKISSWVKLTWRPPASRWRSSLCGRPSGFSFFAGRLMEGLAASLYGL